MNTRFRRACVLFGLVSSLLMFSPSAAAFDLGCTTNAGCDTGTTCQLVFTFLGINYRTCKAPPLCNADSECLGGTFCLTGTCRAGCRTDNDCAVGSCVSFQCRVPSGGSGKGSGIPGEGRRCMPADGSRPPNWATDEHGKPLGACPSGTTCNSHGFCTKPEA